jgi:hypothetical protein
MLTEDRCEIVHEYVSTPHTVPTGTYLLACESLPIPRDSFHAVGH